MAEDNSERPLRRRSPSQRRSRNTVDCIKQAALTLAQQSGFKAVTTARIAERAGVSIGSLYQYFTSRESVLLSIYEDVSLELTLETRRLSEAAADRDLSAFLEFMAESILRLHEDNSLVLIDLPREFPELALVNHPSGYDSMTRALIRSFVAIRAPTLARDHIETKVFFLERVMLDSIRTWLWEQPGNPTREALVSGIAELAMTALRDAE